MPDSVGKKDQIYVCRCEEVTLEEIDEWIDKGYDTVEELKRVLRVGMGPCQGRGCQDILMREIAKKTGKHISEVEPATVRPPAKPIKIGLLAEGGEE
ncbi:MAG: (2Fe-2S)-binding protein [Synergistaceae bacterium]|jgi:bacterioferritin-associated ferredoxin|uniref:(2Fe-2S)-binding protein n=1 Tax=Aminivibrio sp. TaxID=1872489 RepID=UPI0016ABA008|nr:(2Fe-2S)-binding protein [Synergistaceae bacterium]NCC57720.1 (2Fe-2S)-binding protein [Synergistales bacterium]MDD3389907.1 (2Fe-2S)-binding protein [Synergistaceae bacterium]MDD3689958.1 (2Fe-2S)-binding protein [Synergistaceae bacterium]MDD4021893.1 (2Fe-2S)-binding protein [Synergistaceae bacterium]